MYNKIKSLMFDLVQIGSIIFFLLTAPVIVSNSIVFFIQIMATFILLVSVWEMRRTKYYRVPDIGKPNELVQSGIYKYIRNPMYVAQLLFCGALLLHTFSLYRLIVYILFFINFVYKIQYEETLLRTYFKKFEAYKKTSWRLLPFIY